MVYTPLTTKEHLPEILEEIEHLKDQIVCCVSLYESMFNAYIQELTHEDIDNGLYADEDAMECVYNTYLQAVAKQQFLEKMIKNIPIYVKNA